MVNDPVSAAFAVTIAVPLSVIALHDVAPLSVHVIPEATLTEPAKVTAVVTTGVVPKLTFQVSPPVEKFPGEVPPEPVDELVQLARLPRSSDVPALE